jgi:hypothetical protein
MAVTQYKSQGDSMLAFMESVKDDLANAQEHFSMKFYKPQIKFYNVFFVFFDERQKVLAMRHGAGNNCVLTKDEEIVKKFCRDDYGYTDPKNGYSADQNIYDLMQVWGDVKREILGIIDRYKKAKEFVA